ncbi:lytic murein transglycosylase [Angulomicrobium tetraedrale]|uniref:Lytic murein transglycosylase n=1 Tax=Ancylobacter tetraedralis TaxID=217068 RepID=A0A839ZBS4_9HYPH|nr:lytic murein transglycosylase [Ancylobacter tetraedralis]MBB3772201.1 lytic murein transglycosylase [Ancylobacter tetraedralis]
MTKGTAASGIPASATFVRGRQPADGFAGPKLAGPKLAGAVLLCLGLAGCASPDEVTGALASPSPMRAAAVANAPSPRPAAPARAAAPAAASTHPEMTPQALARAEANFDRCIASLEPMARAQGVSPAGFRRYTAGLKPDMGIMDKLQTQPEFTRTTGDYVTMLVSETRITRGREAMAQNAAVFEAVGRTYGVDPYVVAAIWGIETNYGSARGSYPVLQATGTLACVGRRQPYFRDEFVAALRILDKGDIPESHLRGSWAGAFGLTQFMPTAFQRDAVDFDGDGHRNVVDSVADAMGSTAAKLKRGGWVAGRSWGYEVDLPRGFNYLLADKKLKKPMREWWALGVRRPDGRPMPGGDEMAFLLLPAGAKGPAFLMTDNFKAILSYNPADAYALAIGHLADRIRGGGPFVQPWPEDARALSRLERTELQQRLASRGYDVGTHDGALGQKTRDAVREYQVSAGLVPDGLASDEVLASLRNGT